MTDMEELEFKLDAADCRIRAAEEARLRDEYAGRALEALLQSPAFKDLSADGRPDRYARVAWDFAQAMIEERRKRNV